MMFVPNSAPSSSSSSRIRDTNPLFPPPSNTHRLNSPFSNSPLRPEYPIAPPAGYTNQFYAASSPITSNQSPIRIGPHHHNVSEFSFAGKQSSPLFSPLRQKSTPFYNDLQQVRYGSPKPTSPPLPLIPTVGSTATVVNQNRMKREGIESPPSRDPFSPKTQEDNISKNIRYQGYSPNSRQPTLLDSQQPVGSMQSSLVTQHYPLPQHSKISQQKNSYQPQYPQPTSTYTSQLRQMREKHQQLSYLYESPFESAAVSPVAAAAVKQGSKDSEQRFEFQSSKLNSVHGPLQKDINDIIKKHYSNNTASTNNRLSSHSYSNMPSADSQLVMRTDPNEQPPYQTNFTASSSQNRLSTQSWRGTNNFNIMEYPHHHQRMNTQDPLASTPSREKYVPLSSQSERLQRYNSPISLDPRDAEIISEETARILQKWNSPNTKSTRESSVQQQQQQQQQQQPIQLMKYPDHYPSKHFSQHSSRSQQSQLSHPAEQQSAQQQQLQYVQDEIEFNSEQFETLSSLANSQHQLSQQQLMSLQQQQQSPQHSTKQQQPSSHFSKSREQEQIESYRRSSEQTEYMDFNEMQTPQNQSNDDALQASRPPETFGETRDTPVIYDSQMIFQRKQPSQLNNNNNAVATAYDPNYQSEIYLSLQNNNQSLERSDSQHSNSQQSKQKSKSQQQSQQLKPKSDENDLNVLKANSKKKQNEQKQEGFSIKQIINVPNSIQAVKDGSIKKNPQAKTLFVFQLALALLIISLLYVVFFKQ